MKDTQPARVRLGIFEVDLRSGELCASNRKTVLQEQPLRVLRMLVESKGELVSREEIRKKLWPNDTIVDFDHSINAAIKNLRRALGDSADDPKHIETLARRGYRLMVPVEWLVADDCSGEVSPGIGGTAVRLQPEPRLIGKKVSHYRVLQVIGAGGMGLVYKAEDLKLGRPVALKFLPEELVTDSDALQRFEREAKMASSLNHPNICTVHEIEEHETKPFIVMELLDGETLRDRLARAAGAHQTLPLDHLLDVGVQICTGLQAAHGKGIVHCDIKPANIFLTSSGAVKILDFGVAKLTMAAEAAAVSKKAEDAIPPATNIAAIDRSLTRTGAMMGTAGYMSPEQVRDENLDARTDLFSLGLVLYEMATGQRAFSGETQAVHHDAIPNTALVWVHDLNSTLPPKLEEIISKALEKDRKQRYQSAAEMRADLQQLKRDSESATWPAPSTRAASGTRGNAWKMIVSAATILIALAAVGYFYFHFHRTPSASGSVNPAPYEDYLTALRYMQRYDKPGNVDLAIQALQNSVQADPSFALGYAQLGEAYRLKNRLDKDPNWLAEAQANCKKAAEIDNRIPAVHVTLARIHDLMGHHDLALQEFQQALDLDPHYAAAISGLAHAYEGSGRSADAEAAYQKAAALGPDSWDAYDELGNFYNREGKFEQAIQQYQHALQLTPDNAQVYANLGGCYLNSGDNKLQGDAEQALKKSIELSPSYPAYTNLGNLYMIEQRYAESAAILDNAIKINDHDYVVWSNLVLAYEWLNNKDKAEAARRRMLSLLEQEVKMKPQDAEAQATLAVLNAHYGLTSQAESRIQTALALAPDDPDVLADVAEAYELLGKRDQAIEEMHKAIQKGFAIDEAKGDPELKGLVSDPKFHQQ